jgi:hypothetical protein
MPCERKCDPDQSKTGWGWIPERCPWTPSGGMGARRRLPTVATVTDHNALRGDPLLHHQSRLSQKERVAGVQLTPIIRSLSDPRVSCPWCACNTSGTPEAHYRDTIHGIACATHITQEANSHTAQPHRGHVRRDHSITDSLIFNLQ